MSKLKVAFAQKITASYKKLLDTVPSSSSYYPFCCWVSRTKTDLSPWNTVPSGKSMADLFNVYYKPKTFAEMCDQRAAEIYRQALGKKIYVLWSGGIDSSAVLVSLLRNVGESWVLREKQVEVLCTHHSIKENRKMYELLLKLGVPISYLNPYKWEEYITSGNAIIITGEYGDQVLGQGAFGKSYLYATGRTDHFSPNWKDAWEAYLTASIGPEKSMAMIDAHVASAEECPYPIENVVDFKAWLAMSQEWAVIRYRLFWMKLFSSVDNLERVVNFYQTDQFELWSFNNPHLRADKGDISYRSNKMMAKEYIVDFTKDVDYLEKRKEESLQKLFFITDWIGGVDQHDRFINIEDMGQYAKR